MLGARLGENRRPVAMTRPLRGSDQLNKPSSARSSVRFSYFEWSEPFPDVVGLLARYQASNRKSGKIGNAFGGPSLFPKNYATAGAIG